MGLPRAAAATTVPIICKAVAAADCVVLPIPKDLPAQDVMSEVIDELGEGAQTILALTRFVGARF